MNLPSVLSRNQKPFIYVAMGDSTAEGMGASTPERAYTNIIFANIKAKQKNSEYHNLGRSGNILKNVVKAQLPKAIELQPDLITISVGANDIIRRTKQKEFEEDFQFLIKELVEKTEAHIIISTVPDLSLTPAIPRVLKSYSKYMAGKLNKVIHALSSDRVIIVDVFNDSKELLKAFPEALGDDTFHPSDFGYALWANTLLHFINPLLTSPKMT